MGTPRVRLLSSIVAAVWSLAGCPCSAASIEDAALPDVIALLMFDLEEGGRPDPDGEPARRSIVDGATVYEYIAAHYFYGSTDKKFQDVSGSKYQRFRYAFRQENPCIVEFETTIEYSQKDSKEVFGPNAISHPYTLDLGDYRRLVFERDSPSSAGGALLIEGDDVFCQQTNGVRDCTNDYLLPIGPKAFFTQSASENDRYFEIKYKAVEAVKKHCPGRSG